jgi:hypothetical protein
LEAFLFVRVLDPIGGIFEVGGYTLKF